MRSRRLDRLFERFRRRGDVEALGKVFDATAPELYRIAVQMTHDLHSAEDLVQATFLAAIETRDRYDGKRELLPWLLGIMTKKAAWDRRDRSRVIAPDRLHERIAEDPSASAERCELADHVAEAIEQLPHPYREVLAAHLGAGQSAQEIAHELNRAPGTVRVQLHRGPELLRRILPAGILTGGLSATMTPRGLAAVRLFVMGSAQQAVAGASGLAVAASSGLIGGAVMSLKHVAVGVVALLVLATVAFQQARQADAGRAQDLAYASATVPTTPVESPDPYLGLAEYERREVVPLPQPRASKHGATASARSSVSGRVLLPDGSPANGAFVALVPRIDGALRDPTVGCRTDAQGNFTLRAESGPYVLVGSLAPLLPASRELELSDDSMQPESLVLGEAAHIRGRVFVAGGIEPAAFKVWAQRSIRANELRIGERSLAWFEGRFCVKSETTLTDGNGAFDIEGLEPGLHTVIVEGTSATRVLRATWEVTSSADGVPLQINYGRILVSVVADEPLDGAQITLIENREGGAGRTPADGLRPEILGSAWGTLGSRGLTSCGQPGLNATFLAPPGARYLLSVDREEFESETRSISAPAEGETVEYAIHLARRAHQAELRVSVELPTGQRVEDAEVALFAVGGNQEASTRIRRMMSPRVMFGRPSPTGAKPDVVRKVRAENGILRVTVPAGRYEVRIEPSMHGAWFHDPLEVDLPADGFEFRQIAMREGGRLRIRCVNQRGDALAAACRLFDDRGVEVPVSFFTVGQFGSTWGGGRSGSAAVLNASAPQGENEVAASLAPGNYRLQVTMDGYENATQNIKIEPSAVTPVVVNMLARQ